MRLVCTTRGGGWGYGLAHTGRQPMPGLAAARNLGGAPPMPHRRAAHVVTFDNSLTGPRLRLLPPPPLGLPSEYKLRIVDDHELPTGKTWLIVVIPGRYTIVAWSRRLLAAADETTEAMIDACWTAYRALTN